MKTLKKLSCMIFAIALLLSFMPSIVAKAATEAEADTVDVGENLEYVKSGTFKVEVDSSKAFESYNKADDSYALYQHIAEGENHYDEYKQYLDEGYDMFAFKVNISVFTAAAWTEGEELLTSITVPVPTGYDGSSLKRFYYCGIPGTTEPDYSKVAATSSTDSTATFPSKLMAEGADNKFMLRGEIFFEMKKAEPKKGADDGATDKGIDGNEYTVISNEKEEVKLSKLSPDANGKVTIPETAEINGKTYKVTEIAEGALQNNSGVTSVTVGKNVKKIGNNAMAGCKNLTSVDLGSPDEIGEGALSNCTQLTNVKIPETIKKISAKMMAGCTGLTSVDLGSAEEIDEGAISKCKKLKKVTIPATTKKIGKNAFKDDSKLTNLTINAKSLKTVDKNAIRNINPKAKITVKGTKKQQKVVVKLISKKSTGYKKTMKIKKAK